MIRTILYRCSVAAMLAAGASIVLASAFYIAAIMVSACGLHGYGIP